MRPKEAGLLLANKNKLALAAELANLAPWEYNLETGQFEFEDEFYAVYGTTVAQEGRFMSFETYLTEFVHPDDICLLEDEILFYLFGGEHKSSDIIHRILRRDGEVRYIHVRRRCIKDSEGKIIKIYGANQDITERVRGEEERKKHEEVITHMAYVDSLTGLANRQQLNKWLATELRRAREEATSGKVLVIDLDDLKMLNNTYGHTYGDEIIISAGNAIANIVKDSKAFVARSGGDEFIVVLPGIHSRRQTDKIALAILEELAKGKEILGNTFFITASIGIAAYPNDGDSVEEIIKNSDNAMYAAKEDGKNCWRYYTDKMQHDAYVKIRLADGLRCALEKDELFLVYQPQIVATTKAVVGVEALLRWRSSEYGVMPPQLFIPIAEQFGFIHSIGKWVLNEACRLARRLNEHGWGKIRVAVNISPKQIAADDFIAIVCNALQEAGIQAGQLELEITETSLLTSLEEAVGKLIQLKKMGIHLSLDDFGTGFSSLTYLRRLPIKRIKIDKSFIDMIESDIYRAKLIGSIISMAHTLDMSVVAEGVETTRQRKFLIDNECDCIQGYIFSRPLREEALIRLLSANAAGECSFCE